MAAESSVAGIVPQGLARELGALEAARLDWRSYLWRFLVQTPTDFQHFDRRFVGSGLYLETLSSESVHVHVAVDTSGSIDGAELRAFAGEVQEILRAYPHLRCDLYYADAELHGPYRLTPNTVLPPPIGGGGTDFRPFFGRIERTRDPWGATVVVYLTDGYGTFPTAAPGSPTLWVVSPGGKDLAGFPFGETVRMTRITANSFAQFEQFDARNQGECLTLAWPCHNPALYMECVCRLFVDSNLLDLQQQTNVSIDHLV
jgi:predicted metal-dependent peptidase